MPDVEIFRGEAIAAVTLTYEDALDISAATMSFEMKAELADITPLVTKDDSDFDDTNEAIGITSFSLSSTDTDREGDYIGQVKAILSADVIDKTRIITIRIKPAVVS